MHFRCAIIYAFLLSNDTCILGGCNFETAQYNAYTSLFFFLPRKWQNAYLVFFRQSSEEGLTLEMSASSLFTVFTIPTSTFTWYNPLFYSLYWCRSALVLTETSISLPMFLSCLSTLLGQEVLCASVPHNHRNCVNKEVLFFSNFCIYTLQGTKCL